ncbi:cilia- and flagella-associated protein HOATZ [Brachyistius frenatus]|uniref:cilia- and flagella-associated protein HOATZ n=1 Tax=Brachyistius frenatus TaxID=100188 RepID=UPI0037E7B509
MSVQPEPPEQDDVDKFFTVFEGSSPEDVSNARQLWSSVSLQPPLESRLVSADIRQRLPVSRLPAVSRSSAVSRPPRSSTAGPGTKPSDPEPPNVPALRLQQQEERQRYEAMAEQRKEILALQRRQREQRIQKELLRAGFKPKLKVGRHEVLKPEEAPETEADKELVRRLQ